MKKYPHILNMTRMSKLLNKVSKYLLLYLLYSTQALAIFGESCAPLILAPSDGYLRGNTLYGHLVGNMDMKSHVTDPCNADSTKINFCFKSPAGNASPCGPTISMDIGEKKKLSDLNSDPLLGNNPMLKDVVLTVIQEGSTTCLTMPTSLGPIALGCKMTGVITPPQPLPPVCSPLGVACKMGDSKSQSLFNFSGIAIDCIKETLDKLFFEKQECIHHDQVDITSIAPFSTFQEALKVSIRAAFVLYVVFYGFKIVLHPESSSLSAAAAFILKLVVVMYFSVGLGPLYYSNGKPMTQNGMLEWGLPILVNMAPEFATIVFNSGGSRGLCEFNNNLYKPGYKFYSIWDAIDCRIGYYLGIQLLYDTAAILKGQTNQTFDKEAVGGAINLGPANPKRPDILKSPLGMGLFVVMFGFLLSGNLIVVAACLAFALIFMSVCLTFLTTYIVCLVTIYTMTYISPIFIPMVLFERTKAYYDSWLKIIVSCSLQPAVIAGYIALLLNMFDSAIYKTCQFRRHDYALSNINFSTFEIRLPMSDTIECMTSLGYKLLKFYNGDGWNTISLLIVRIVYLRDTLSFVVDLLYVAVFSFIFYYFSQSMSKMAADLTNGPSMEHVVAGPMALVELANKAKNSIEGARDFIKSGGKSAADQFSGGGGGGGASDQFSSGGGGGGAADSFTGGSK